MNNSSDLQKTVWSFIVMILVAYLIYAPIYNLFLRNLLHKLQADGSWWVSIFWGGYLLFTFGLHSITNVKNKSTERSLGIFLGQRTGWEIPTGLSWWWPRPIGKSEFPTSIVAQNLDHTRDNKKQLTQVITGDGSDVEVSLLAQIRVSSVGKLVDAGGMDVVMKAMDTHLTRGVRWFVNCFHVDDISGQQESFSNYLLKGTPPTEGVMDGRSVDSDPEKMIQEASDLGVKITYIRVDDINPPEEIVLARKEAARENAEADKEQKNVKAFMEQMQAINGGKPITGLEPDEVLRAALVLRKDIKQIHVSGNAGDVTKGAATFTENK